MEALYTLNSPPVVSFNWGLGLGFRVLDSLEVWMLQVRGRKGTQAYTPSCC